MKVLVIHASAGAGHTKAAEALYDGFRSQARHSATLTDALDHTSRFFKKTYQNTYTVLVKYFPWVWGTFFILSDIPGLRWLVRKIRRIMNSLSAGKLAQYLIEEKFDYLFSTHFLANEVSAALKRRGLIQTKIVSVVTDFDAHSIWVAEGIDHYAVACDHTKDKLIALGVDQQRITVTGIPVHSKFARPKNKTELRKKFGLKDKPLSVLVATGSFGMGPMEELIDSLRDYQVLVVCGHNKTLFKKLNERSTSNLKIFGLVDNMEELMAASDVMITKPGGLSISEALVSHLPLIFFSAIPGQETNNMKVLGKYGIAIQPTGIRDIASVLNRFETSPSDLIQAQKRTEILAQPQAVVNIINLLTIVSPN